MKKNIVRVLSLLLVAAMLVVCTACSQTVYVRFVDKDGNDINFGNALPAGNVSEDNTDNQDTPSESEAPSNEDPSEDNSAEEPSGDDTTAPTDNGDTTAPTENNDTTAPDDTTKAPENTTAAPTSKAPSTKDDIVAFYSKAVNDIKKSGVAGYDKLEYQTITNFNITGIGFVDSGIKGIAGQFFKDRDAAEVQVNAKGSDEAKNRMYGWELKDKSKVVSATLQEAGGNYNITIVMADEDTPHNDGKSHLDQVGSVLVWEDIAKELEGLGTSTIDEWDNGNIQVLYTKYTITATISPDGKISAIKHHTDVVIQVNHAKLLRVATLNNKNIAMENTCEFSNFKY